MSEPAFTPGPWIPKAHHVRVEHSIWSSDGLRCVAQMVRPNDALLIATAPDLYGTLELVAPELGKHTRQAVEKLLAKARGEP